jgi:anti-anti-sigma factor
MEHTTEGSTLELVGSLDVRCTAELREAVYGLLARQSGDVHVDISRVDSVDLTTLKMLAVANRTAERHGQRVILRGGSPGVRRLLHLSHLRWMLPVEPNGSESSPSAAAPTPPSPPDRRSTAV